MFEDFTHILFDFDGTLCDSAPDIRSAWMTAFDVLGVTCPHFDAVFRTGPPLLQMTDMLFPEADAEFRARVVREFKAAYDHSPFANTRPYPGIDALLKELKGRGAHLYIATNKRAKPLGILLGKCGWENVFELTVSPDSFPGVVMDKTRLVGYVLEYCGVSADAALMVGDTAPDIAAGHANKIRAAGVLWGYGTREELTGAGADIILSQEDLSL